MTKLKAPSRSMSTNQISSSSSEITSLSDRLGLMFVVRLFMVGIVLLSATLLPQLPLDDRSVKGAYIYLGVAGLLELLHRFLARVTSRRWLVLVNLMLLLDGVFIAMVLAGSGQSRSAFIFLAYAHIVSVTLLVSFRTGLKIAAWHSMLLLVVYYLVLAGWLPEYSIDGESRKLSNQLAVASAIALWLVAIVTAGFASLNERELRRRKGELTIIADLSSVIEQTRRPSEILQALIDVVVTKLNSPRALAVCAHSDTIVIVGGENGTPSFHAADLREMGGVVTKAIDVSGPVLVRSLDPQADARLIEAMPNATNVSVIPLIAEGQAIAVLVAEWGHSSKRRVSRPMIDLLSNVAGRVALSLSNTFLLAEVQRLASVDGLTGLPNRRTFNQAIERELARAARTGQPVSLVMLDIDHFKSVNDNHGHQMGDQVLSESAAGVMSACRSEDLPARYGGEEMAVIMPNCSPEQAILAANRIRLALSNANITLNGITASAGVATFPHNADSVTSLLAAADEALYQSKENGRNRATASTRISSAADSSSVSTSHL